jgi:hypothetical protein
MGALLGALMMVGAFATDAFAQRFDREERRRFREREWVFLGEKTVGFRVDRDAVRINQPEDWYRTRSFRSLHLVADRNDVYFLGIELVYLNGYSERFRVDRLVRDGEDFPIDLRGERSFIREIVMTYRARPDFRGEAVIRVYGEPSRRGPGFPGPGFPGPGQAFRQPVPLLMGLLEQPEPPRRGELDLDEELLVGRGEIVAGDPALDAFYLFRRQLFFRRRQVLDLLLRLSAHGPSSWVQRL